MSRCKGQPTSEEDKFKVKQEIVDTIHRICTGDATTCLFGYCKINCSCAKPYYTVSDLDYKAKNLESILKNARRKERKKNGIIIPPIPKKKGVLTPKKVLSKTKRYKRYRYMLWRCNEILGQSIYEHDLVKNHQETIDKIKGCISIKQIIPILQSRHEEANGYKLNLPKGRAYYNKYKNED